MSLQCSWIAKRNPPPCKMHNESLVRIAIPIDRNVPDLGVVECYVCPVSRAVVDELKDAKTTISNG
jgi:hypothetical protein